MGAALAEPAELAPLPVLASLGLHDGVSGRVLLAMRVVPMGQFTGEDCGTGRYYLLVGSWWLLLHGSLFCHPNCFEPIGPQKQVHKDGSGFY